MRFSRSLVFLSLISALVARAERVLQSAGELADYVDRASNEHIRFEINGVVLMTGTTHRTDSVGTVIIEDRTGHVKLFYATNPVPLPGNLVHIVGDGKPDENGHPFPCIRELTVSGKTNLPNVITAPLGSLNDRQHGFRTVQTEGTLIEVAQDELDHEVGFLLIKDGDTVIPFYVSTNLFMRAKKLIGARLRLTGTFCSRIDGVRHFSGPFVETSDNISLLSPAPKDSFNVPELDFRLNQNPRDISKQEKHRTRGRVLAVWSKNQAIIKTPEKHIVNVSFANGTKLPERNKSVCIVGYPQTDLFGINLVKAHWKSLRTDQQDESMPKPTPVTTRKIMPVESTISRDLALYHGRLVTIDGLLQSHVPSSAMNDGELRIINEGITIRVITPQGTSIDPPEIGSTVRATGICCQSCETWQPYLTFPHIYDCKIILQSPDDLQVLAHPPFWTPPRLFIVIAILTVAIVAIILIGQLVNRIVMRHKVAERTRLAVELHDSLSQTLTGITCQIVAGHDAVADDPQTAKTLLGEAERMLESCRNELKNCLFDLRNNTIDDANFARAIERTLVIFKNETGFIVRFPVNRALLTDSVAHTVLCIIRELVANAVRHGNATQIRVAGNVEEKLLSFSVTDNGLGFNPRNHPGPREGHFGLTGIQERLSSFGGTMSAKSSPGKTRIVITLPL